MRIVGGELKGRKILAPKGREVRPTSDRTRESVFNILENGRPAVDLRDQLVVDVFAGTGALGLEAMSRGARHVVYVDNSRYSRACIQVNADALGVSSSTTVISADGRNLAAPPSILVAGAGIVFVDPPYHQNLIGPCLSCLIDRNWVAESGVVVAEMESEAEFECPAGFGVVDCRTYGAAKVVFLARA